MKSVEQQYFRGVPTFALVYAAAVRADSLIPIAAYREHCLTSSAKPSGSLRAADYFYSLVTKSMPAYV